MTKKKSKFDKFIHNFASQHLKRRVKTVSVITLVLMLLTVLAGIYLVQKSFSIVETGSVSIQEGSKITIVLAEKYEKLISPNMELYGRIPKSGLIRFEYEIQDVIFQDEKHEYLVHIILKNHLQDLKGLKNFKYELYLERKTYWKMLLESST